VGRPIFVATVLGGADRAHRAHGASTGLGPIRGHERLGGVLKFYDREAA
jgi:hypothetical protein